ncbi:MAG: hypothetical protein RJA34_1424 [Pseudomonadota bacterium]
MRLALDEARLAADAGEVPVGAVLVKDGRLIASAHNTPISGHDPTAHAEVMALRAAAQSLGNYRLEGCELYVTLEPCAMCAGAMLHARLSRVIFGASDPKTGAAGSVVNLFDMPMLNHQTQVTAGVLAEEAAGLLRSFFKPMRANPSPLREDALRTANARWAGLDVPHHLSHYVSHLPSLQGLRLHWFDGRATSCDVGDSLAETGKGGYRSAKPLSIALHGTVDWSLRYASELRAGEPILAIDLPGFGLSDKPKRVSVHTLDWHASVLAQWIQHLAIPASAQALCVIAPREMQRLVEAFLGRVEGAFEVRWDDRPEMPQSERLAPYPDKGHLAGPRALRALLDN